MIYKGPPAKHLRGLAKIVRQKINENTRCLYLNSPGMVAEMASFLSAAGLEVAGEVEKGSLILSSDQSHLVGGHFDVDRMIGMLSDAVRQAVNAGYNGLWASGDMAWEFGNEKNFAKLLEYEHTLDDFMAKQPALFGICQYHADVLPTEVIHWGLYTHRSVYINETLSRANPYYAPSRLLTQRRLMLSSGELDKMLARPGQREAICTTTTEQTPAAVL